jgi:hypothetical protein
MKDKNIQKFHEQLQKGPQGEVESWCDKKSILAEHLKND